MFIKCESWEQCERLYRIEYWYTKAHIKHKEFFLCIQSIHKEEDIVDNCLLLLQISNYQRGIDKENFINETMNHLDVYEIMGIYNNITIKIF